MTKMTAKKPPKIQKIGTTYWQLIISQDKAYLP